MKGVSLLHVYTDCKRHLNYPLYQLQWKSNVPCTLPVLRQTNSAFWAFISRTMLWLGCPSISGRLIWFWSSYWFSCLIVLPRYMLLMICWCDNIYIQLLFNACTKYCNHLYILKIVSLFPFNYHQEIKGSNSYRNISMFHGVNCRKCNTDRSKCDSIHYFYINEMKLYVYILYCFHLFLPLRNEHS